MKTHVHFKSIWVLCIFCVLFSASSFGLIDGKKLTIGDSSQQGGAPYFYATLDAAGYSDWIFYGNSPDHDYGYHELLSGEYGSAAIYYDGIGTTIINPSTGDRQAMWLTQQFEYPYWPTNSNFTAPGICAASSNPNNPTPLMDTGQSFITNGDVEITVDYEVVDLEPLGSTYSPMSFIADPNGGSVGYMYSDRYVFLQTYTIRNKKAQTLTNLEFYQFLHSHGADEYGPYVNSTYCDINLQDPLANYTPYNPVHTAGSFRYDITQWNGPKSNKSHTDYVNFSSTVEPDWIDNHTYNGHSGRPSTGTHIHIENRQLNGINRIFNAEAGGAMGWALGSLDPNETVSMTIAFMFGQQQETSDLSLTKTDDVETGQCVQPGSELRYTITWENLGFQDAENAVLVDYLPAGVDFPAEYYFDPNTFTIICSVPEYDLQSHTYTLEIGTIPASGSGELILDVVVNNNAEPGMLMKNKAVLTTSIGQVSTQWGTQICYYDEGDIIYVDWRAIGTNIGTSWANAYTDLQSALARAAIGCSSQIWVAHGTYDPGRLADTSFVIPAGVSVYGGFAGYETIRDQRNPKKYQTILTGAADAERNSTVVRMGNNSILDGFTITGADEYGIYGSGADFTIENCTVEKNNSYGIRSLNSNVTVKWCEIRDNRDDGIRHDGSGVILAVENCRMLRNRGHGIFCQNSTPIVRNSIMSESDLSEAGNAGIRILNPRYSPVLHNNTFAHNRNVGVSFTDNGTVNDPNGKDWPDVQNCILWHNNKGQSQFTGFSRQSVYYSCIYDPNDPEGNLTPDVNYNFSANPKFAYLDPNNVRIVYDSPCKDAGNPYLSYDEQVDMDRRERMYGAAVDMGAYEIDCEDISNPLDWNADGLVNLYEFNSFSRAWLSHDPNDPVWMADPNLADPNLSEGWYEWKYRCNLDDTGDSIYTIDLADLMIFVEEIPWGWKACWLDLGELAMQQMASGGDEMLMMGDDFMGLEGMQFSSESSEQPEMSLEDQITQLQEAIAFLEQIWLEDPAIQQEIDPEVWQEFMEAVYQGLFELQTDGIQIE